MNIFAKIIPFILLGMAIVAFAFGLLLFTYLLIFGAIVGLILFVIAWIKERFFSKKQVTRRTPGRTIDHKD